MAKAKYSHIKTTHKKRTGRHSKKLNKHKKRQRKKR